MSEHRDQLTPTPFEPAAQQPASAPAPSTAEQSRRWLIPALLALLLLAASLIFILPQLGKEATTEPSNSTPSPEQVAATQNSPRPNTAEPPAATPWSDAQQARWRKEAQEVLAQLLELQEELQQRAVEQWAAEPYSAALSDAAKADELYKQREFVAARDSYQAALVQLQSIQAGIPQTVSEQLALAEQAIEAGQLEQLRSALEKISLLAPDHEALPALRERAAQLPDLVAKLEQASAAEAEHKLDAAVSALQAAMKLDPEHKRAAGELARVTEAYNNLRFNQAMSEGYAALDDKRFNQARQSFQQARTLRPDDLAASRALQELHSAESAHQLISLKSKGARQEQQEQWQQALQTYQQALKLDPSVIYAQEGLQRAQPRAQLEQQLQALINKPQRLSDPAVAKASAQLLAKSRQIAAPGPVLQQQIKQLEQVLEKANTTVSVTLRSDQQTSVTIYKVARLGQFSERQIDLRPGNYTAVGSRDGYRDVRRDFSISSEGSAEPIVIVCTEAI